MRQRNKAVSEYVYLLILASFKNEDYSITALSDRFGLSINLVDDLIHDMIENEYLEYSDYCFTLTYKGRILLQNTPADYFDEEDNSIKKYSENAWPIDKIFIPQKFYRKR